MYFLGYRNRRNWVFFRFRVELNFRTPPRHILMGVPPGLDTYKKIYKIEMGGTPFRYYAQITQNSYRAWTKKQWIRQTCSNEKVVMQPAEEGKGFNQCQPALSIQDLTFLELWTCLLLWAIASSILILFLAEIWVSRCKDDFDPKLLMSSSKIACCVMALANNQW